MKKRSDWAAWRMAEETRVQINRRDLAKAFVKATQVRRAGYSVTGHYLELFHVKESVDWVNQWMKNYLRTQPATN